MDIIYEFSDNESLLKKIKKYEYNKNYKLNNPELQRKYALDYYYKTVLYKDGREQYNLTKKIERQTRKIKNFVENN